MRINNEVILDNVVTSAAHLYSEAGNIGDNVSVYLLSGKSIVKVNTLCYSTGTTHVVDIIVTEHSSVPIVAAAGVKCTAVVSFKTNIIDLIILHYVVGAAPSHSLVRSIMHFVMGYGNSATVKLDRTFVGSAYLAPMMYVIVMNENI